jgi:UDP-N-acetylglucosamine acyltransferase
MLNTRAWPTQDVHETAIIDPRAELGADVIVEPYAVIGPNVVVGNGTRIGSHVLIERDTVIGAGCDIHHGAVLGTPPQDLKYKGESTQLIVGDRTVVREYATLNRGTTARGRTEVGSDCLIMAYAHVAHDCVLGDRVILSNAVNMGGHVEIDEWVIVGGMAAIHQFVRIGAHAFVGGASRVSKDVPPYVRVAGSPLHGYGLNTVGLMRRGFPADVRMELKRAYRLFYHSSLNVSQALVRARTELQPFPEVQRFLDFIAESQRGITL